MGVELVGFLRGWPLFDHAAHLSGMISGYLLYQPSTAVWRHRARILRALGIS
jgi:hypothetical protein